MKLGGEVARIARHDHPARRVMAEKPRDISHRDADRFQRPRRLIDQQSLCLTGMHSHQLMCDGLGVHASWEKSFPEKLPPRRLYGWSRTIR